MKLLKMLLVLETVILLFLLLMGMAGKGRAERQEGPALKEDAASRADCETGAGRWKVTCPAQSSLKMTQGDVKEGGGALEFGYTICPEKIVGLVRPGLRFTEDSSVSFRVRTAEPSEIVLALEERDRSRYIFSIETEACRWQQVEAPVALFNLTEDTSDENGRLDAGQLNGWLFVADLDNFTGLKSGRQTLWIDDFRILQRSR